MRIAIFTEIFNSGGVDTFVANLITHWPVDGDEFVVIANRDYPGLRVIEALSSGRPEVIRHDVRLYARPLIAGGLIAVVMRALAPLLRYVTIAYNVVALRGVLARADADILMVVNGGYPGGDSCRAASISWGLFSGNRRSIHNFHNLAQRPAWYARLQEATLDRLVCRFTRCFVTVSHAAAESMAVRPTVVGHSLIRYIYNGINRSTSSAVSSSDIRREFDIPATAPLCLMLGTYEPRKGHRFLLEAFRVVRESVPDAHLLVCGYGSEREVARVRQHVRDFRLDAHVHLANFRTDTSDLIGAADVLVVASQCYESFGLTSVEAMAHRVPVVATDVGGIPEVVVNGEGGYCVGRDDLASYARRIVELLTNEEQRRDQGDRGFRRYQAMFTAQRMAADYFALVNESGS